MCHKLICINHIRVKKACLVLSIISAVCHGLMLIWWFYIWYRYYSYENKNYDSGYCGLKLGGICWGRQGRHEHDDAIDDYLQHEWRLIPVTVSLSLWTVCNGLFFIFTSLLCHGIHNRRPGFLQAYLMFGVVATVIIALCSAIQLFVFKGLISADPGGLLGIFACVLHSWFLAMVVKTHKELLEYAKISLVELKEVTAILPSAPSLRLLEDVDCEEGDNGNAETESVTAARNK